MDLGDRKRKSYRGLDLMESGDVPLEGLVQPLGHLSDDVVQPHEDHDSEGQLHHHQHQHKD